MASALHGFQGRTQPRAECVLEERPQKRALDCVAAGGHRLSNAQGHNVGECDDGGGGGRPLRMGPSCRAVRRRGEKKPEVKSRPTICRARACSSQIGAPTAGSEHWTM